MAKTASRTAMIDAAEAIVAERGLGAMSLREVQTAAGQLNKNAAQYHFGSREGLIAAVVEARMGPINERRWRMIEALEADPPTRTLVEALILPLAEAVLGNPGSQYARFLAQALFDPQLSSMITGHIRAASYLEVLRRLVDRFGLPADLARLRAFETSAMALATLANWERDPGFFPEPSALAAELVDAAVAVLLAPSTLSANIVTT